MFTADTPVAPEHPASPNVPQKSSSYPFRLLRDENVLGTFPVARVERPLGKVASFLFVTDSRVIYSAEAKALGSSSTHLKEYQVQTVTGVEVARHRGLDAIGTAAAAGAVLNFILLAILASLAGAAGEYSYSDGPAILSIVLWIVAAFSLVIGIIAAVIMSGSTAEINVIGPGQSHTVARGGDLMGLVVIFFLLLIFGPLISVAGIAWVVLRELGIFKASDAQLYADSNNVDQISYEIGALILDVQARGTLAGQN